MDAVRRISVCLLPRTEMRNPPKLANWTTSFRVLFCNVLYIYIYVHIYIYKLFPNGKHRLSLSIWIELVKSLNFYYKYPLLIYPTRIEKGQHHQILGSIFCIYIYIMFRYQMSVSSPFELANFHGFPWLQGLMWHSQRWRRLWQWVDQSKPLLYQSGWISSSMGLYNGDLMVI